MLSASGKFAVTKLAFSFLLKRGFLQQPVISRKIDKEGICLRARYHLSVLESRPLLC